MKKTPILTGINNVEMYELLSIATLELLHAELRQSIKPNMKTGTQIRIGNTLFQIENYIKAKKKAA